MQKKIAVVGSHECLSTVVDVLTKQHWDVSIYLSDASDATLKSELLSTSLEEALTGVSYVLTYCKNPSEVEDLYFNSHAGLLAFVKRHTKLVDLSISTPSVAHYIASITQSKECTYIDAPLDHEGNMFVGASKTDVKELKDVFKALAEKVFYFDKAAQGMVAYCTEQLALAGALIGMCDALSFAGREGLNLDKVAQVLLRGISSRAMDMFAQKAVDGEYTDTHTASELNRDIASALLRGEELNISLPASEASFRLTDLLCRIGGKDLGVQTLSVLYQDDEAVAAAGLDWSLLGDEEHLEDVIGASTVEECIDECSQHGKHEYPCAHEHDHDCKCGHSHVQE